MLVTAFLGGRRHSSDPLVSASLAELVPANKSSLQLRGLKICDYDAQGLERGWHTSGTVAPIVVQL